MDAVHWMVRNINVEIDTTLLTVLMLRALLVIIAVALFSGDVVSIDHDKVQPFAQPDPVTVSEKAAVKFKPMLTINGGCASYPAVNAAGEITGGLKGTGFTSGCKVSLMGSQVYGRSVWYNDVWAIMYAWYFPKGFWGELPSRRHDWANVIVWIDNPASETPSIVGLSTSYGDSTYKKIAPAPYSAINNGTTPKFLHTLAMLFGGPYMIYTSMFGEFQDLIMWEQLTDEARTALNTTDFGDAKVPFIDANFEKKLEKAWPF
ncbi:hypothetical protein JM18_009091 [Phytophthora kernoviae]|uniref:Necrosis inducing protein NPP1 type n=1 Tax=Phytophthora kernoviae TaxID=325452 RepID=A0A921S8M6_9STRA|nr:hypothetical protein JM18_009091 [Phytophthora kernoviae]